jgi:hypothetical protein
MRRPAVAAVLATALLAAGCGGSGPSDTAQVRSKVTELGKLTAAKDYTGLCDHVLAAKLIDQLKQVGLPCELALQHGLGDVTDPRLTVGAIAIKDQTATAQVRTSAKGQQPSRDTIQLVKANGQWRVSSLGG